MLNGEGWKSNFSKQFKVNECTSMKGREGLWSYISALVCHPISSTASAVEDSALLRENEIPFIHLSPELSTRPRAISPTPLHTVLLPDASNASYHIKAIRGPCSYNQLQCIRIKQFSFGNSCLGSGQCLYQSNSWKLNVCFFCFELRNSETANCFASLILPTRKHAYTHAHRSC
jgi:hypothetical protein